MVDFDHLKKFLLGAPEDQTQNDLSLKIGMDLPITCHPSPCSHRFQLFRSRFMVPSFYELEGDTVPYRVLVNTDIHVEGF